MKPLIMLGLCASLMGCFSYESGEKVGDPVKLGTEGFWCGNRVGTIIKGGFNNGTGAQGMGFDFNFTSDEAAENFNKALNSGRAVKIFYHKDYFLISFCLHKDNYLVDKVEILK